MLIDLENFKRDDFLFACLAMCMICSHKWIEGIEAQQSLFTLKCPICDEEDSFASILPQEYMVHFGDAQ